MVSDTDSGPLFHFPHHCRIGDFRRLNAFFVITGRFSRHLTTKAIGSGGQFSPSMWPHNPATGFRPLSATVVSAEPFSHGTGTLRCLQKEMATYRYWSVSLWRDADDVSHCWILSPDKTEWRLISATLCGWKCCFVADQLWLMKRIREEEVADADKIMNPPRFWDRSSRHSHLINPETKIWIHDRFWLRLDALVEVCTLWAQFSLMYTKRFQQQKLRCWRSSCVEWFAVIVDVQQQTVSETTENSSF